MSCTAEKQARAEVMLGEIAEQALMLAKDLALRARQSEDDSQAAELADAFHKVSRVVRLTLALDFKLDRDAARDAREQAREAQEIAAETAKAEKAARPAPVYTPNPTEVRKDRVRGLAARLLWNECEGDDETYQILQDELTARLDEAARNPDFEDLPIQAVAQHILTDMGLSAQITVTLGDASRPREAAGGGPSAERSEEPRVEGASLRRGASTGPPDS